MPPMKILPINIDTQKLKEICGGPKRFGEISAEVAIENIVRVWSAAS